MSSTQNSAERVGNSLTAGVTEESLLAAIHKSGYPFQAEVVDRISRHLRAIHEGNFDVDEEWAFVDGDSGSVRAVDALLSIGFPSSPGAVGALGFSAQILIECKQTELPYVCFVRPHIGGHTQTFPEIAGIRSMDMDIYVDEDPDGDDPGIAIGMSVHDTLAIFDIEFFTRPCPYTVSISKVARKAGGKLEMTGEDAYRSITLPLLKAADYLGERLGPKKSQRMFGFHPIMEVAVISGPLFSYEKDATGEHLHPINWVRACRLEPSRDGFSSATNSIRYFDIVHESYLEEYFSQMHTALRTLRRHVEMNDVALTYGRACVKLGDKSEPPHGLIPFTKDVEEVRRWREPFRRDRNEVTPPESD
jgi:hypothetical protein